MWNLSPYPGFVGPSYKSQSPIADIEATINFYVENVESPNAKSAMALYPTPGTDSHGSSALSPNRGCLSQDGRCFFVIGQGFYEIDTAGSLTLRGTVDLDGNPATISSSGDGGGQLFITSGGSGYIFDLVTLTFSQVVGLSATMGDFLDGFFLALDTVNSTLRISDYLAGLTWDPTQFRVRSAGADKWVAMKVIHKEIWLLGTQTYEVWSNVGASPFPFFPIPGVFFTQGIAAPFSIAPVGESLAWLSANAQGSGMVMIGNQYAPQRISNHAVEDSIQQSVRDGVDISDFIGMSYQEDGHVFYILSSASANITWCWDQATNSWHQRGYWNVVEARYDVWRPRFHAFFDGKHLVGDGATGAIYTMGVDKFYDVGGAVIRRLRRAPHVFSGRTQVRYNRLELDLQAGLGLSGTGLGSDPQVMMRYSDNGGATYGNERMCGAGKRGKYGQRVYWNRLGQARDRVFEVVVSDPIPWRIVNAYLGAQVGIS